MTDIEICLTCGNEMTYWFVIQNEVIFLCPRCDDEGWIEDPEEYEEPCLCREDTINPFCPNCY